MRTEWKLAAILAAAMTAASPALAAGGETYDAGAPATNIQVSWRVYLAGVVLGKINFAATLKGEEYSAQSTLETGGIVNAFWESRIMADSRGIIAGPRLVPVIYNSDTITQKSSQIVALGYTNGFPDKLTAEPAYDLTRFPVNDDEKRDTVDPLSAMVLAMSGVSTNDSQPCGAQLPVFDGRRRYNVNFTYKDIVTVNEGNHDYRGGAYLCEMEYVQLAGFKPNLDPEKRPLPKIYAWMVPAERTDVADARAYLPVKIWAETAFGQAVAQARYAMVNGATPPAILPAPETRGENRD